MAIDCNDFKHDSNLTIEIMLMLFPFLCNNYMQCHNNDPSGFSAPRTLFIQMDNTCRDNKNKYTLMFMFLLVEFGVFEKVNACSAYPY